MYLPVYCVLMLHFISYVVQYLGEPAREWQARSKYLLEQQQTQSVGSGNVININIKTSNESLANTPENIPL
jgi:hypothetical protein